MDASGDHFESILFFPALGNKFVSAHSFFGGYKGDGGRLLAVKKGIQEFFGNAR